MDLQRTTIRQCSECFGQFESPARGRPPRYCPPCTVSLKQRPCDQCGVDFIPKNDRSRFCGKPCTGKWKTAHRRRVPCQQCGTIFAPQAGNVAIGGGRFCKRRCYYASRRLDPTAHEKRCPKCKAIKPAGEFYRLHGSVRGRCKECYHRFSRHPSVAVQCQQCGITFYVKPFTLRNGDGKFHSVKCRGLAKRTGYERPCARCGKPVRAFVCSDRYGIHKYCGEECAAAARQRRVTRRCLICRATFWLKVSDSVRVGRGRYCSKKCSNRAQYKGGRYASNAKRRAKLHGARVLGTVDYLLINQRDRGRCWICAQPIGKARSSYDHAIPLAREGEHSTRNIRLTHYLCNVRKGAKLITHQPFLI